MTCRQIPLFFAFKIFMSNIGTPILIHFNGTAFLLGSSKSHNARNSHQVEIHSKGSTLAERFLGKNDWYYNNTQKVLGKALVNKVSLKTILREVEAVINNRSLTYTSCSINDPTPTTPSLLLMGRRNTPWIWDCP